MPGAPTPSSSLKAEDIMTRNPVTIDITGTVQEVADAMFAADVRHIPVVQRGTLLGMVSDRDLRSYMLPRSERILRPDDVQVRLAASVEMVMRADALTVTSDTSVATIIDLFLREKIGAVPVLAPDTRELLGMVSYLDVLRAVRTFF